MLVPNPLAYKNTKGQASGPLYNSRSKLAKPANSETSISLVSKDDRAPDHLVVRFGPRRPKMIELPKEVATNEVKAGTIGKEVHLNSTLAKVAPRKKLKRPSNGEKYKELSPSLIDSGSMPQEPVALGTLPSATKVTIGVSRAPSPQAKVITTKVVEIPPSLATRANRKMGQSSVKALTRKEDGNNALGELSVNERSVEED
ncbi:hypothetical protein ACFE04_004134 [Oxalis oulophora]